MKIKKRRRLWFDPRRLHVGFMVENVALAQVFLEYHGFPLVSIIPSIMLLIRTSFFYHQSYMLVRIDSVIK